MSEDVVDLPPAIKVVFDYQHQMEGDRVKWADAGSAKEFRESLGVVSKASPITRWASENPVDPVKLVRS